MQALRANLVQMIEEPAMGEDLQVAREEVRVATLVVEVVEVEGMEIMEVVVVEEEVKKAEEGEEAVNQVAMVENHQKQVSLQKC